jgi:hypothetical protein
MLRGTFPLGPLASRPIMRFAETDVHAFRVDVAIVTTDLLGWTSGRPYVRR